MLLLWQHGTLILTVNHPMTTNTLAIGVLIFGLRVVNNAIGTVRLVTLARGQRAITAVLAFFEALVFAITISGVVADLSNIVNLMAYCGGFAVGSWLGMALESRLVTAFLIINVFATEQGHTIALALRQAGFGVTEMLGEGHEGNVTMLRSVINHRDADRLMSIVHQINPEAFVAIEQARTVQGGTLRSTRNQPA